MATGALVSEQEYLSTTYKPSCDFIDGVLRQKPMPTWKHSLVQGHLTALINRFGEFLAGSEFTVKIRTGEYLVPDVAVQRRDYIQDPYAIDPIHLCAEILSSQDRFSVAIAKCEEYHAWGVGITWIIDPESRRAWEFCKGDLPTEVMSSGSLTAGVICVSLADLFSVF